MLLHIDMVYTHALCPYARKSKTQKNNALMSFTIRYLSTARPSKKTKEKKQKKKRRRKKRGMRRREGDYRGDKEEEEEEEGEEKGCGVREQELKPFSYGDTLNLSLWHKLCSTTHEPR